MAIELIASDASHIDRVIPVNTSIDIPVVARVSDTVAILTLAGSETLPSNLPAGWTILDSFSGVTRMDGLNPLTEYWHTCIRRLDGSETTINFTSWITVDYVVSYWSGVKSSGNPWSTYAAETTAATAGVIDLPVLTPLVDGAMLVGSMHKGIGHVLAPRSDDEYAVSHGLAQIDGITYRGRRYNPANPLEQHYGAYTNLLTQVTFQQYVAEELPPIDVHYTYSNTYSGLWEMWDGRGLTIALEPTSPPPQPDSPIIGRWGLRESY